MTTNNNKLKHHLAVRQAIAQKFAAANKPEPEPIEAPPNRSARRPSSFVEAFSDERARLEASCLAYNKAVGLTRNRVAAEPEPEPEQDPEAEPIGVEIEPLPSLSDLLALSEKAWPSEEQLDQEPSEHELDNREIPEPTEPEPSI